MNNGYTEKPNRGNLFVNAVDGDFDKMPDWKGVVDSLECPHCKKKSKFWVSAWNNISKTRRRYLSIELEWDDPKSPYKKQVNNAKHSDHQNSRT